MTFYKVTENSGLDYGAMTYCDFRNDDEAISFAYKRFMRPNTVKIEVISYREYCSRYFKKGD